MIEYYIFCLITISFLALLVSTSNIIHAGVFFLGLLVTLSLFLLYLNLQFLSASYIIIYVGTILVFILYGIMMSKTEFQNRIKLTCTDIPKMLLVLCLGASIFYIFHTEHIDYPYINKNKQIDTLNNKILPIQEIGEIYLTKNIIIFEFVSIFLLICLIGVSYLTKKGNVR